MWQLLRHNRLYLPKVVLVAMATATVIAVPTRLVENGWFSRMTPVRSQDYLFLALTSVLTGLVVALPNPPLPLLTKIETLSSF